MHYAVIEQLQSYPQKVVDLKWLELELDRIVAEPIEIRWNAHKQCVELTFDTEEEYQLLHRWSEHVGAALEVREHSAFIYR